MKIGEWDSLGRARGMLQRQLGELGAAEYAAHVTLNPQNGRLRILVATDIGLLDYSYQPGGADTEGRGIWRLTAEDPKMELTAESMEGGEHSPGALLPFARACIQHAN